jgi:beta-hydroxylase
MVADAVASRKYSGRASRWTKKAVKRLIPLGVLIFLMPFITLFYLCCGTLDVMRNRRRTASTIDLYFAGIGLLTWLLSPFNLLMDVLAFPFRNKGIYQLSDLPQGHQDEINALIEAAHRRDLVGLLRAQAESCDRSMIFFKWYGKNLQTSVEVPEYHHNFKYIRTIGVSVFNKRQSTSKHYGPLRVTLRVLYNINQIESPHAYIQVGSHTHHWKDGKLFIFDDTLQHKSCNESDEVRYCLFVDILRPAIFPGVFSFILSCVGMVVSRFNYTFYREWKFIK